MEQTLGKRISSCRKKLGLTQDQLAEQLGVTAQAVSKWENDQSCPDITMLPKLAGIFSISTDELLGLSKNEPVHQAQVVEEENDEDENDGIHLHWDSPKKGGSWEFKWDSGRKSALLWAFGVLLVGILLICSEVFTLGADFWEIMWPTAILIFGLDRLLSRFSFFGIGCTLLGGYYLLDNMNIWKLNIAGELVFPILVVLFGLSLLVDALRKPKKPRFSVTHHGKNVCVDGSDKAKSSFTCDDDSFETSLTFGEATRLIEASRLESGEASCAFGELTVDLSSCEEIADGCSIDANCSFGQLTFLVPAKYRVHTDCSTAFASFDIKGQPDPETEATIQLDGSASFGQITIRYI